jgi:SAM-dependent methyltransferase
MPRDRLARWLFHALSVKDARPPTYSDEGYEQAFERDLLSTHRFFDRFHGALQVEGRSVLDVGCGSGATCIEAAERGATRAVGVDIQPLDWSRQNLQPRYPHLAGRVELVSTDGSLRELGGETFDVVLSKDSFEHYADPEAFVSVLAGLVEPGGTLAIGFGPLWKSPTGAHIDYMTKVPWAHLLFPERVIMAERRRFRPAEDATRFEEVRGGLNRMTLARFERIMRETGLRRAYLATNVSDNPVVRAMALPSRVRPLREYFTSNVYGVWEKPAA